MFSVLISEENKERADFWKNLQSPIAGFSSPAITSKLYQTNK